MCSHKSITWKVIDNSVADRMIDNSLLHKFASSRRMLRRTKVLNAEIKKCGMKEYKQYVNLKTNVLRNVEKDSESEDPGNLTEIDYSLIYNSESTQAKYIAENMKKYVSISEEDWKSPKRRNNTKDTKHNKRNKSSIIKVVVQKKNLLRTKRDVKCNTKHKTASKKHINVGWQEVRKQNRDILHMSDSRASTNNSNNEENMFKNKEGNSLKIQSNNQFVSSQVDSQSSATSSKIKPMNRTRNNRVSHAMINESDSENSTICSKTEIINESRIQNYEHQNAAINESNVELDPQNPHHQTTLSSLENVNELSAVIKIEYSDSKKSTQASNENLINAENCSGTYASRKSKLLKNVRRNLIPVLEEVDFPRNNDKEDKSVEDRLNSDQLPLSTVNSSCHSTSLRKKQTNVSKSFSPDASSLDQHKDSGFDDDSQDKVVRIEQPIVRSPSLDIAEKMVFSPEKPKLADMAETITSENSKEDINNVHPNICDNNLEEQDNKETMEFYGEGKVENSPRLNQTDKDAEIHSISQKDTTHFVKAKESISCNIQKQPSPKQNRTKDKNSKSYNGVVLEKQDNKIVNKKEEIKSPIRLNQVDKDAEICSINQKDKKHFIKKEEQLSPTKLSKRTCIKDTHLKSNIEEQNNREVKDSIDEEKIKDSLRLNQVDKDAKISVTNQEDKTHVTKLESCDIQSQPLISPKKDCIKDAHSKSTNILEEQDDKEAKEDNKEAFKKEVKNFCQLNQVDKDMETYSMNENKTDVKDLYDVPKQRLLKVTCTEIINKKYKIVKKDDIDSDVEKVDDSIINKYTPIKNNTLINSPDVVSRNIDNWQKKAADVEEVNKNALIETDNEEENANDMSPQTRKRLQQQARLNLVVSSDSSESDDKAECVAETSRKRIDSSDTSRCSEDKLNDGISCASEKTGTDISSSEDTCMRGKETTIPTEDTVKQNSTKKDTKKKANETAQTTKCTRENNNSYKSTMNKSPSKQNEFMEDTEHSPLNSPVSEFSLRFSESNALCSSRKQFSRDQSSLLNKENARNKNNQSEDRMSVRTDELGTSCKSGLDISCQKRSRNLQELVEDQKLVVETMPAGFTLSDISDDDEAFIMNIPNKVLQCNLQGQMLTIKKEIIKFGKNKFRIVRRKVGTTSCIFATGKEKKPYKTVNIKKINTITVRERLPHYAKKPDISNSHGSVISDESKSTKIDNRQTDEINSKLLKISGYNKRKRRNSNLETKQSTAKKVRLIQS